MPLLIILLVAAASSCLPLSVLCNAMELVSQLLGQQRRPVIRVRPVVLVRVVELVLLLVRIIKGGKNNPHTIPN